MERCYEKSGNWSAVLRSLEEQRDLVTSLEFQHHLDSKIQWVLVEHLADSDLALETYQRIRTDCNSVVMSRLPSTAQRRSFFVYIVEAIEDNCVVVVVVCEYLAETEPGTFSPLPTRV